MLAVVLSSAQFIRYLLSVKQKITISHKQLIISVFFACFIFDLIGQMCDFEARQFDMKNVLTEFRKRRGDSKSHLARMIGVCASYITRLENNDIQPSGEVMFRIAAHFKCRIEDIFKPETLRARR